MTGTDSADFLCCIECGSSAPNLYKAYKSDIIKISHCEKCGKVVDKYIEYESMIIFLDAVLHKAQAYRHILFNVTAKNVHHKLLIVYLFFDTFLKWDGITSHERSTEVKDKAIFYAAMEIDFYRMFIVTAIESIVFVTSVLIQIHFYRKIFQSDKHACKMKDIYRGLLISSYGKLFTIPAIIWGQSHSAVCLLLAKLFIFTSNLAALKVLCKLDTVRCAVILGLATTLQTAVVQYCALEFV